MRLVIAKSNKSNSDEQAIRLSLGMHLHTLYFSTECIFVPPRDQLGYANLCCYYLSFLFLIIKITIIIIIYFCSGVKVRNVR